MKTFKWIIITMTFLCSTLVFAKRGGPLNPYMSYSFETDTFATIMRSQKSGIRLVSIRISGDKTFYMNFNSLGDLNAAWFFVAGEEKRAMTEAEQKALKAWVTENEEEISSSPDEVQKTLQFLVGFLPPSEEMEDYQSPIVELFAKAETVSAPKFVQICEEIGNVKLATFSRDKETFEHELKVGEKSTRCRGRCGTGCSQLFQKKKNQYTQECLNHDACSDAEGTFFGECSDEFWEASSGYMNAPDCNAGPVSK
ncbi:MAG: hypothetical protein AB7H97_17620 [Pseudobdellovibrionaceae bacterium]